ncbi:MAG TPA: hypothetical protein VFQ45_00800 [Longimicrobium sp.]|nr:hypothetical protein [Longimicrobium sp.]
MKKVKLEVESLEVESFETAASGDEQGTVFGHATLVCSEQWTCTSCDSNESCLEVSCGASCGGACGDQTYAMHSCEWWQSCDGCNEM